MLNVNRTAAPNMHTLSLFVQQDKNNITAARTAALGWPTAVLKGGFIRGLQNLQGIFVFSFFCFHSLIPSSILQREITEHKNLKPPSTALCTLLAAFREILNII